MASIKVLESVTGTLSKPSKMPCFSYSLSPSTCNVGQKLAEVEGSTCNSCYACKGNYVRYKKGMAKAWERRAKNLSTDIWTESMIELIGKKEKSGYFRFHDSGDLQDQKHLDSIIKIVDALPHIQFWLPTKEKALINKLKNVPKNLTIRLSSTMIDGPAPKTSHNTATVTTNKSEATCKSFNQNGECGDCRKCWNRDIQDITYLYH
jgi:hypothetical protein